MGSTSESGVSEALTRLEAAMSDISAVMHICKAPSISMGVLHEGQVIFRRSIGKRDVEEGLDADSDTAYNLASCSKLLTSAAIGMLDNAGLSLGDTVRQHLPDFDPVDDPQIGRKATIRDLCRHTTGLANPAMAYNGPGGAMLVRESDNVAMANALPTSNKAGQRFRSWWYYSNIAYALLADVVEAASGLSFPDYLRERLCRPLRMSQTLLSGSEVRENANVAHPYFRKRDGTWTRLGAEVVPETHGPALAAMGVRSSVNDMLAFCAAVLNSYGREEGKEPAQSLLNGSTKNPLRNMASEMWNSWWTRPCDDGFENDTAYTLGWFRTTMPTAALGSMSYNSVHRIKDIIGRESEARILYGNYGVTNGGVATVYVFPASRSAIVALSNAADAGDAAETTSQLLTQALFDMKPSVDLLSSLLKSRRECLRQHDDMVRDWEENKDVAKYSADPEDLIGSYLGLGAFYIDIVRSEKGQSGLAVVFGRRDVSRCELEPFNADALSFLPTDRDERFGKSMIDWDFWAVGVFNFVRENEAERKGSVVGLRWRWDRYDYPGFWVKLEEGMSEEQINRVIEKHGRFLKEDLQEDAKGDAKEEDATEEDAKEEDPREVSKDS